MELYTLHRKLKSKTYVPHDEVEWYSMDMANDIYTKDCPKGVQIKPSRKGRRQLKYFSTNSPLEFIVINILEPVPKTDKWQLVTSASDGSKLGQNKRCMKTKETALNVAYICILIIIIYRTKDKHNILTDNSTQFVSISLKTLCPILGTTHWRFKCVNCRRKRKQESSTRKVLLGSAAISQSTTISEKFMFSRWSIGFTFMCIDW